MVKQKAFLSLVLLVPAPSIGVCAGMIFFPNTAMGSVIFGTSKIWLFCFPILWHIYVDKEKISYSKPEKGGFGIGAISGILISIIIVIAYLLLKNHLINADFVAEKITEIGLAEKSKYLFCASYWILINSVLEEYVWRWFVVKQCEVICKRNVAIISSTAFFTLHHILAIQIYFGTAAVVICSLGIFVGGTIWSAMYIKYRSVWPGYLSHGIVDLCIFTIGWFMIFG